MSEQRVARRYTRLSEAEWSQVEEAWASGSVTLEMLADEFDVSIRNMQNRFAARGIVKGGSASGFIPSEIEPYELGDIEDTTAQAMLVRARTVAATRELQAQLLASVRALRSDPTVRPAASVRVLAGAAAALERLTEVERRALGLDDADLVQHELPTLQLVNLTAMQIEEIQRGPDGDDDGDLVNLATA